jgi:hypothetical protein
MRKAYVVFNILGLYYGQGGFTKVSPQDARFFDAAGALSMLKAFPNTSTVAVFVADTYEPEDLTSNPRFSSSLSRAA